MRQPDGTVIDPDLIHKLAIKRDMLLEVYDDNYNRSSNAQDDISRWLNETMDTKALLNKLKFEKDFRALMAGKF